MNDGSQGDTWQVVLAGCVYTAQKATQVPSQQNNTDAQRFNRAAGSMLLPVPAYFSFSVKERGSS